MTIKKSFVVFASAAMAATGVFAEDKPCSRYWLPQSDEAKALFAADPKTLPLPDGLASEPEPSVKVVYNGNLPMFSINGRTYDAELVMEYIDNDNKWSPDAIAHFRDAGSHIFRIRTGTWHLPDGGPYDFSALDTQARRLLAVDPNAYIELIIRFEMPNFCKAHKGDTIAYGVPGEVTPKSNDYKGFPLRGSPASAAYRTECTRIIESLCRQVREAPWGKRVVIVRPCWGVYTEWHYYGFWNSPGMCGPMADAFRRWRDGKWADAGVPTAAERTHNGFLMDPKTDQRMLDFYRCMQEEVVSLAHLMARTIKRGLPGRLVGIYYGYVMTAQPPEGANVLLDEMLVSPDIDFLSNPCHYNRFSRRHGGAYPQRTIPSFYRRRGKLCIAEDDTRFHFVADFGRDNCPTETPEETRAIMRRNYLNRAFDGCGIQYCDSTFGGRGKRPYSFDNQDVILAIRESKAAIAKAGAISVRSGNEVAVVVDYTERLKWDFQGSRNNTLASRTYDKAYLALTRSGVPTDLLELRDYLKDGADYKYVVFLNLFGPDESVRERLRQVLGANGATAIWMVAPGCVTTNGFSDAAMSEMVGMKLKGAGYVPNVVCADDKARHISGFEKVFAKRRPMGGTSVFVPDPIIDPAEWARLFDALGVHRYIEPGACFRRQGDVFMLHVGEGGKYRISLPRKDVGVFLELFTERVFRGGAIDVESAGPETWFFKVVSRKSTAKTAQEPLPPIPDDAFTYVVIPDTQLYRGEGAYARPGMPKQTGPTCNPAFSSRIDWIERNIKKERIAFVSHVGDIVDMRNPQQWAFASEQMAKLDGKVPYGISVGNHDTEESDAVASGFTRTFPASRYKANAWYAGHFGDNVNSCQLFEAGGMKFVVLHLECNAPEDVLEWADGMMEKYCDRMGIVVTHMYLGFLTEEQDMVRQERQYVDPPGYGDWFGVMAWKKEHGENGTTAQEMWDRHFSKHQNLFLILCGDQSTATTWRQLQTGRHGNVVHSILQDYPRKSDREDWLRLLRFRPAKGVVEVYTYSPVQDRLCDDAGYWHGRHWHQFEIPLPTAAQ